MAQVDISETGSTACQIWVGQAGDPTGAMSAADTHWTCGNLPPGRYRVEFNAVNFSAGSIDFTVPGATTKTSFPVTDPAGRVSGAIYFTVAAAETDLVAAAPANLAMAAGKAKTKAGRRPKAVK